MAESLTDKELPAWQDDARDNPKAYGAFECRLLATIARLQTALEGAERNFEEAQTGRENVHAYCEGIEQRRDELEALAKLRGEALETIEVYTGSESRCLGLLRGDYGAIRAAIDATPAREKEVT